MKQVVITAACRTPIGTMGGQFRTLSPVQLTIPVMQALVRRAGVDPAILEDVVWGCNYQRTYLENNLARVAAVKAGFPDTVPGITLHRNCTSSMSAVQVGYYQIRAEEADCIMAGGTDSMSTAPHMVFDARYGKKFGNLEMRDSMWDSLNNLGIGPPMGITAENVAKRYGITRQEQDALALLSHRRAVAAIDEGRFRDEIIPVTVADRRGETVCDTDEHPRRDTTLEKLARLRPTFLENGTVTAGNSSGMNDGASGILLMSGQKARELGAPPLAEILATSTVGVPPEYMGIAPIGAVRKALDKAGLTVSEIDLFEINEAFAAQCIACERELGIDRERLNVNGSGISLGHPVGCTGSRMITTLIYELRRRGGGYGVASLCAGGGMGTAIVLRVSGEPQPQAISGHRTGEI